MAKAFRSGAAKHILNDWSFNGFLIVQSGNPLSVTNRDSGRDLGGSLNSASNALFANVDARQPLVNSGSFMAADLRSAARLT